MTPSDPKALQRAGGRTELAAANPAPAVIASSAVRSEARDGAGRSAQAAAVSSALEKNSAWLMTAFTVSVSNGLVIRKAGSGRSPVRRRSG